MRRFFQFSLRTALVFMTLCSLALGWFGANLREWQAEQEAIVDAFRKNPTAKAV